MLSFYRSHGISGHSLWGALFLQIGRVINYTRHFMPSVGNVVSRGVRHEVNVSGKWFKEDR